ncbi:MAG: 2-C-methyl-D-erythritol 2,4-cyclodiphosphate synthase [Spirochaetes bacterium]|nr:2-C-methyl-D-erythritol 2,4-cyclodiphosphate synthase [Spirochaetota bacterium]
MQLRIGIGFDVHPFCEGRPCILGGVDVKYPKGLGGHSDADVLVHAIIDSLLGAANEGDIGALFPDSNAAYKDIKSIILLEKVYAILQQKKITIINIDSVVVCEEPKILPAVPEMKHNISKALGGLSVDRIGIKGTTTEKLGFTGRKEGIAAQAISLLYIPGDYS